MLDYSWLPEIIVSLLASLIIFVVLRLYNKWIFPWFQNQFYRGIRVHGTWIGSRTEISRGIVFGFTLALEQNGFNLTGTFTAKNIKSNGELTEKTFKLSGEILNNVVLLDYSSDQPDVYGRGSFLFQVYNSGKLLKGGMVYLQTRTGQIRAIDDLELSRNRNG